MIEAARIRPLRDRMRFHLPSSAGGSPLGDGGHASILESMSYTTASRTLPNYIRSHRKRLGLSQDELAWILGASTGTKVSRYERFRRHPNLFTVFACEVVFRRPARRLFAGMFAEAERKVMRRLRSLLNRLGKRSHIDPDAARKVEVLAKLCSAD